MDNSKLTITVEYTITGDSNFTKVLRGWIDQKKILTLDDNLSIWEFSPDEKVISTELE